MGTKALLCAGILAVLGGWMGAATDPGAGQVTSSGGVASAADQAQPPTPDADLTVTLEHVSGKTDTYGPEIVKLELILDGLGKLDQVHLITKTGAEADTHIWYNVANLVSVRYRFLEITGKGKVTVRALASPVLKESEDRAPRPLVPLDPQDYR
jgi:hypothetical protein